MPDETREIRTDAFWGLVLCLLLYPAIPGNAGVPDGNREIEGFGDNEIDDPAPSGAVWGGLLVSRRY